MLHIHGPARPGIPSLTTRIPGETVAAALRHLLAQIPLLLQNAVPVLRVPFACVALWGAWGALLYLMQAADALGRTVPSPVSAAPVIALFVITFAGGYARRPYALPHERAWRRAKAAFVVVAVIAVATCHMAFLLA